MRLEDAHRFVVVEEEEEEEGSGDLRREPEPDSESASGGRKKSKSTRMQNSIRLSRKERKRFYLSLGRLRFDG
ncbi:hypothetical protein FA13DRAFT_1726249 [Coprinellus micaceus]|uniref:Uncharacterized protein n=1 Tax=Coprinellus micaceus TaxID=71717 RepID=A0A4Y7TSF2_COPMI|nr:hypothetical protein FA13DRAFT_1726249 [Coprinellus micaceus]